jgi:sugar O-acyltransferase (sialic acid O-acetyltransferase NeuD family)
VIFGAGEFAEVAKFYFDHDSDYTPVAFTVDRSFMREEKFAQLPVIPFEDLAGSYPPGSADLFIAIGYSGLNRNRAKKVEAAKALGYTLGSFLSSRAWAWPGFELGENTFIFENNNVQPFTTIGSNTIVWSGNHFGHHSKIGAHCFVAGHAIISGGVTVGDFCFIGVNATIREHITIGERCIIGMHAAVLTDAAPGGVYDAEGTTRRAVLSDRVKL